MRVCALACASACACVCACVSMCEHAHMQRLEEAVGSPAAEVTGDYESPDLVLGTELQSSVIAANAPNYGSIYHLSFI